MIKFSFICLIALLCSVPSQAQNSSRQHDNFDIQNVRVKYAPVPSSVGSTKDVPPSTPEKTPQKIVAGAITKTASNLKRAAVSVFGDRSRSVSTSLGNFTTGDAKVDALIADAGKRNNVDPALLYSIMHQESSFKSHAVSNKGASGLMQLMPATAIRFGVRDRFDKRQNIEGGARYMSFLLGFFKGSVPLALAGYNAGEGAVLKYNRQIPPYRETQEYVRRITKRYALMRDPQAIANAPSVTKTEIAAIKVAPPPPITVYERDVFSVRLPNGKLHLVSQ